MSRARARVVVAAAVVVVLVAGGVGPGAAVGPVGGEAAAPATGVVGATGGTADGGGVTGASVAAEPRNGTAGGIVASGVATQGDSLGRPLESSDATFDGEFYGRVASFARAYNERQPDLGTAGEVAKGEVVNLHVVAPGGEEAVVSFRLTEDNRIRNLRAGPRTDATIRIEMDTATFERIATADDPGAEFEQALEDDEVTVTRRGGVGGTIESLVDVVRDLLG